MPYLPHSAAETEQMLKEIGVNSVESLFDEIPDNLKCQALSGIPDAVNEMELAREMKALAQSDAVSLNFLGAGCYEHHIPAAVWDIASRGEYLTAYTPYQAEVSQGTLQVAYEFQTMIARLMGLPIANASLYEGATALAEALLMTIRMQKKRTRHNLLIPDSLHPHYRQVLATLLNRENVVLTTVPFDPATGTVTAEILASVDASDLCALVIPQPNFFGVLEDGDSLSDWAHAHGGYAIACVNPTAMAILKPPGEWGEKGADIACGEGQPLGIPMASGGPFLGFLACQQAFVRQVPGRLIGRTTDSKGHPAFCLTLQAREQHIRRGKATSNICTAQSLLATAATLYMSVMGAEGLRRVALASYQNLVRTRERLARLPGVSARFDSPTFHEAVFDLPVPAEHVLSHLEREGIQGGFALETTYGWPNALLICVTETKTVEDIERFATSLASAVETCAQEEGVSC